LVDRFLAWQVPDTVASDTCMSSYLCKGRSGTNIMTADEARQMLYYLLEGIPVNL
jgi:hypothetical protein